MSVLPPHRITCVQFHSHHTYRSTETRNLQSLAIYVAILKDNSPRFSLIQFISLCDCVLAFLGHVFLIAPSQSREDSRVQL